jgi:hypothetical protein
MKTPSLTKSIITGALLLIVSGPTSTFCQGQNKPDWQQHIDWSIGNHTTDPGETNCPDLSRPAENSA